MGHIPVGVKWYVADIVLVIRIDGDPRNVVHKNKILIRADSPIEAYEKAVLIGQQNETSYQNPSGRTVQISFQGLSELSVIHDELEHGAELFYEERIGMKEAEIRKLIVPKDQLSVFRPISRSDAPDYSSN